MVNSLKNQKFFWNFGTTSFRRKILRESNIQILNEILNFWSENKNSNWNVKTQEHFYNLLAKKEIVKGTAKNKVKDARAITSSLVQFGFLDDHRQVTEAGNKLLDLSINPDHFNNFLCISSESYHYFLQFLKLKELEVCPLNVLIKLLLKYKNLSYEFIKYFLPLITSTEKFDSISKFALENLTEEDINQKLIELIFAENNYKQIANYFINAKFKNLELFKVITIDRKSNVSAIFYYDLYYCLLEYKNSKNLKQLEEIFFKYKKLNVTKKWKKLLFERRKLNLKYLNQIPWDNFDDFYIKILHCLRVKSTLEDYFDLNCRHLTTTDILLFEQQKIGLVSNVEKVFKLIENDFQLSNKNVDITKNILLNEINPCFEEIVEKINDMYKLDGTSNALIEFGKIVNQDKECKFLSFIKEKYNLKKIISLLELFNDRNNDLKIHKLITDETMIPAIYEYIISIAWWLILEEKVDIYDVLKDKISANFLPIRHTAGLLADVKFNVKDFYNIPDHSLLIEVTLSDKKGQRKMEFEPVQRHSFYERWSNDDDEVLTYFISPSLDMELAQMFRNLRNFPVTKNDSTIEGVNIMSLTNNLLIKILKSKINYSNLYKITINALKSSKGDIGWFKEFERSIENFDEKNL